VFAEASDIGAAGRRVSTQPPGASDLSRSAVETVKGDDDRDSCPGQARGAGDGRPTRRRAPQTRPLCVSGRRPDAREASTTGSIKLDRSRLAQRVGLEKEPSGSFFSHGICAQITGITPVQEVFAMIYFMDQTGRVIARSRAVKIVNGTLVPDSLGLPVLVEEPREFVSDCPCGDSSCDIEGGPWCSWCGDHHEPCPCPLCGSHMATEWGPDNDGSGRCSACGTL
jgi:hypothetical protein